MAKGKMPRTLFDKIAPAVASPKIRYHGLWFFALRNANNASVTKKASGTSTMALLAESIKIPGKIKIKGAAKEIQESLYR